MPNKGHCQKVKLSYFQPKFAIFAKSHKIDKTFTIVSMQDNTKNIDNTDNTDNADFTDNTDNTISPICPKNPNQFQFSKESALHKIG